MRLRNGRASMLRETNRLQFDACEPRRLLAAALPADVIGYASTGTGFANDYFGVVADPAHNRVFAIRNTTLIAIDTDTAMQVASIKLAADPEAIALSADGSSLLVAEMYAHQVQVLSTATLTSQRILNVGVPLLQLAGGAGGKFYAVASTDAALASFDETVENGSQSVVQFDLATGARGVTLDVPNTSTLFIRADSRGERLYVGSNAETSPYGDGGEDAIFDYDISNPAAPSARDSLDGSGGGIVDLFDDRTAGQTYLANATTGQIDVYHADGTVAHWSADLGDYADAKPTGLTGLPGGGVLFATFDTSSSSSLVAFDATSGAVRHVYALTNSNATPGAAVTPNGRVMYPADLGHTYEPDEPDAYGLGIVGSTTLRLQGADNVVFGEIFHDANHDGVRQTGEDDWADEDSYSTESSVIVYADLNNNGVLDARGGLGNTSGDEPSSSIGRAGTYRLDLPTASGTYTIRLQTGADYFPHLVIFPTKQSSRTVTLTDGQQFTGVSFGVEQGVEVAGTVFADLDGDGVYDHDEYGGDTGEPTVGGSQVYLDLNRDGLHESTEPLAQAGDDGSYTLIEWFDLTAAAPGPAIVRLLNPKGYALTTPASVAINGAAGEYDEVFFGVRPQLAVTGTLYDDANANGKRDVGELPWIGARVWLDVDGNGKFTKGEPTALTGVTGAYAFAAKERGTSSSLVLARDASAHPLAIAQKAHSVRFTDWKQTIGGDLGAYVPATITISAYVDRDKNRKHSRSDTWLADTIAFIDSNNNGKQDKREPSATTNAEGYATFTNLPPGRYVVRLRTSSKLGATTGTTFIVTLATGEQRNVSAAVRIGRATPLA